MRRVGALIFPGFELLDLFGPLEMLGLLNDHFELSLVAENLGPVQSNQRVAASADITIDQGAQFDLILVPGRYLSNKLSADFMRRL